VASAPNAAYATSGKLVADRPAPRADRRPHRFELHGVAVQDAYAWLRDPGYPEVDDADVLAYLEAENAYFNAVVAPHRALIDALFLELKGRIKADDVSVPWQEGSHLYQWRFNPGAEYRVWVRTGLDGRNEQLLIDENAEAKGLDYYRLGAFSVSPDGRYLAWTVDDDGSERFTLKIRDLATGQTVDGQITSAIGSPEWSSDSRTLLYTLVNEQWRPFQVRAHRLGTPVAQDVVLYEEQDDGFFVGIGKTQSEEFLVIGSDNPITSEVRVIPAANPFAPAVVVAPRRTGHEYELDHANGQFFIRTNDRHKNFRVAVAPEATPQEASWRELIAGDDRHYLRSLSSFKRVLAIEERIDGLDQVRVRSYDGAEHYVAFPEATYTARLGTNASYDPDFVRLDYQSMVTPSTVFDYGFAERKLSTRKVQEIPSGYDPNRYTTERLRIKARDGVEVPVSVVYRKDFKKNGKGLLHVYGYGAYGLAIPPNFSSYRISLLDRGYAFAIAHIRGGDDLGYQWYLDGKLAKRTNTFNDFVDVARALTEKGFAAPGRISASGGSAGGELMGAVLNQAPELWGAVVAHVPFVDVLNTMLDPTLPLTPREWDEWGNPIQDAEAFQNILAYSPYDQVEKKAYPPLLVTAGLNDPRVTYWEPAKWTARLRHRKTDRNILLLKTNMEAGHGGKSGRYQALQEQAEEYAFILLAMGAVPAGPSAAE